MPLITGWATNTGVARSENQDCCYVDVFESAICSVGIAVICDGMGGLSDGAVASNTVCGAIREWFSSTYHLNRKVTVLKPDEAIRQISRLLENSNRELIAYGKKKHIQVGTTASVLFICNDKYYIIHIGDSRVYSFTSELKQITDDDCVAAEKLRRGEINLIEYENSREKHILTQCVGVNKKLDLHIYSGDCPTGTVFFLGSDGMYHNFLPDELSSIMYAQKKEKGLQSTSTIERTIDKMISRGETDNLTGIIVCAV